MNVKCFICNKNMISLFDMHLSHVMVLLKGGYKFKILFRLVECGTMDLIEYKHKYF
jgi:hypothetical protein